MTDLLDFVDSHIHFWDRPHPFLRWDWLEPDALHPDLGDMPNLKSWHRFLPQDLRSDAKGSGLRKVVHIQAAIGTPDPVDETRWLQTIADETGWPNAIIAEAHLQEPDVDGVLERHCEYPNMRGIRDFATGDYLVDPAFRRGFALLEKRGLVFDLDCTWQNMEKALLLARTFPETRIILGHAGFPRERNDEYLASWRSGMKALASAENVAVKISGLGMGDQMAGGNWTIDSIRPYVIGCIEAFGPERSMFGSNWPVDRMYSDYSELLQAYHHLTEDLSHDERSAVFSGTAETMYSI